jgi:hypothetical protein
MAIRKYWKGYGQVCNGKYLLLWDRHKNRESMIYKIISTVTGKIILHIEVF